MMQSAFSMLFHNSDSLWTSSDSTVATSLRISCSTSREPCWKSAMMARALGMVWRAELTAGDAEGRRGRRRDYGGRGARVEWRRRFVIGTFRRGGPVTVLTQRGKGSKGAKRVRASRLDDSM